MAKGSAMPYYTRYYRFDAFFSHCSDDSGWYPGLFRHFPPALTEAFKARVNIAKNRITRHPRGGGPQIHAVGREVGHLAANGPLFDPLYQNARDSFIMVAFIGHNYLVSEACLTELLGFLESKRDPEALKASLFLSLFEVQREQLFDLPSYGDFEHIEDDEERNELLRLSSAISSKLRALYGRPQNLISMNAPTPDGTDEREPDEAARSLATKFALWIATALQQSSIIVDPEPVDEDCRNGRAYPLIVLRPKRRTAPPPERLQGSASPTMNGSAEAVDPAERAIRALEELSEEAAADLPLRGYPIPAEKLLHFADGAAVSPFDPQLPKPPVALVMAREAVAAFAPPQTTLLAKLSRDFPTLQIAVEPPPPAKGVVVTLGAGGAALFEPRATAQEFVQKVQSKYR
jgi:hypothetical protein